MQPIIFLDDGGVMNDNALRGPQWRRLVAAYLAPRLGGSPEAWEQANRLVAERIFADHELRTRADPELDVAAYLTDVQERWLGDMCSLVGVEAPADSRRVRALATETAAFVTNRVRSAFPGAVEAIRRLSAAGYALHTASGEESADLDGYLRGMGVRDLFGTLYGPDLVNTAKAGPLYYRRVFAAAGVLPRQAAVVDDSERALHWAASLGARTILCRPTPPDDTRHGHTACLSALPALLM